MSIKRGDLFWVNLDPAKGSEQAGRRPVVVIQNDIGNEYATTTLIAPLTSMYLQNNTQPMFLFLRILQV